MKLFYTEDEIKKHDQKRKAMKDTLSILKENIPWELFLPVFKNTFKSKPPKAPGGRPAFPFLTMIKLLVLQRLYNLSDFQMEYQILDRSSFKEFLDLNPDSGVPDEKTIWYYRNELSKRGADQQLFKAFDAFLQQQNLMAREGVIVDASFVEVPKAHFHSGERDQLISAKEKDTPKEIPNTNRSKQLDTDARWTKKHNENFFGYKNHVKVDAKSKLITAYEVTPASTHDSPVLPKLLDSVCDKGQAVYADKGYAGFDNELFIKYSGMKYRVLRKASRGTPLTEKQEQRNLKLSKTRARVEHVFGFMENSMGGMFSRALGIVRNKLVTGMMNLTYNILRYSQLLRARCL